MTRAEYTGERNLDFSKWCRKKLNDARGGLQLHDIDFVISNFKTGYFIFIEIKTHCRKPAAEKLRFPQRALINLG